MAGTAYFLLARALLQLHSKKSPLAVALGKDWKGKISLIIYAFAIGLCFLSEWIALGLYALVAAIWFIPDQRIEKKLPKEMDD